MEQPVPISAPVVFNPPEIVQDDNADKYDDGLEYHLHHLIAIDQSPIDKSTDIKNQSQVAAQLIVNALFKLDYESTEDGVAVNLPMEPKLCTLRFPRTLPLPSARPDTRWEKFAKEKNIKKQKRSRLVWDNITKEWVPRWGKGGIQSIKRKSEIVIEEKGGVVLNTLGKRKVKGGSVTMAGTPRAEKNIECPFGKQAKEQEITKSKKKLRELRNQMEADKGTAATRVAMKSTKSTSTDAALPAGVPVLYDTVKHRKKSKEELSEILQRAQISTASFGQHDKRAQGETPVKQKKRQRVSVCAASAKDEVNMYKKQLKLLTDTKEANKAHNIK